MIDFTLTEILTGLDLSEELEADAPFRNRLLSVATDEDKPRIFIAGAYELDAFGARYGLIRHGFRAQTGEEPDGENP